MKFKISIFLIFSFIFGCSIFSQDNPRWSNSSAVYANGNYVELPQKVAPLERSMVPRIYRSSDEIVTVYPNIQVLPSPSCSQTECPLVSSKANPNFMFGSANTITTSFNINDGCYVTTNGGAAWYGTNYIPDSNSNNQRGDPAPIIDKNQRIIFTHLSSSSNFGSVIGIASEYSTDYGITFTTSITVYSGSTLDKNFSGTDDNPSSPYYGNSYIAFCDYSSGMSYCAATTNGGVSWNTPVSWAPPSGSYAQGHDVGATPSGVIIVCYALHGSSSPWTETGVGIGRSTNGGTSFTPIQPAYNCNGTRSASFNGWGIRTNSFPRLAIDKSGGTRNGWIYVVTDEKNLAPAGSDADVILHRSTDGGLTWSAGIRVNQDALNNGKVQFFPCVNVDANGGVNVAYYDNRNFPSVGDSCSVFISRSLDGGNTWTDYEVADHHYKPKTATGMAGGYFGDYIGIAAGSGKVWAFWMDDKTGIYQAWAGYITTVVGINNNHNGVPISYSLSQNYPNPFNPSTKIEFALPKASDVKLVVYDLLGAKVATLVNEHKEAGYHSVSFNAENLASGVYLYKLESGDFTDVKKMVLMK